MSQAQHVEMPYGQMPAEDVVAYLVAQHTEIRGLMRTVVSTAGQQRRDAFGRLVRLLSVHEAAEEEVVHPVARRNLDAGEDMVAARLAEENEAKQMLEQLEQLDPDNASFVQDFQLLRTAVLTHAISEQWYEFSRLRKDVSDAERAAMLRLVKAAEAVAPTHPHPGVESASANLALGTPTAIMDRAKDAIRRARGNE